MDSVTTGKCSVCGREGKLTREHVPPRKAFNDRKVLLRHMEIQRESASARWRQRESQGGSFRFVLCESCNNKTGSWYGSEYVRFAEVCARHAEPRNTRKMISLRLSDLHPARVLKQALVIMCATCGADFAAKNPLIPRLVLNKAERGLPSNVRISLYLRAHGGGRATGIACSLNVATGHQFIGAEFSWWPLGWVLTFDPSTRIDPVDVSHWATFGFDEVADTPLTLPCLPTPTPYPLDFRTPSQVRNEAAQR